MSTVEENKRCILWNDKEWSVWGVYFKPRNSQIFPYGTVEELAREAFEKLSKERIL